jgi:D-tagatose-1,6-bisphosphate aldolase subunit GatZ/KbaZ
MVGEIQNIPLDEVLADQKLSAQITDICGHYTFETTAMKTALAILNDNLAEMGIDLSKYAVRKVRDSIDRYAYLFNLYGLTEKLLNV